MSQITYRVRTDSPDYPESDTDEIMTIDELINTYPWLSAIGKDKFAIEDIHSIRIVTDAPASLIIERKIAW